MAGDTVAALQKFYRATYQISILGDDAFKERVLVGRPIDIDVPELRQAIKRPESMTL